MIEKIKKIRKQLKNANPLVHCITNPISINQCANLILASGCRPIMAEHPQEVGEITRSAKALMFNMGNITDIRMTSMLISTEEACKRNIPVVLDIVGVGCSELRRNFVHGILQKYSPKVIKGNYSEIKALYNCTYKCSGVDVEPSLNISEISRIAVDLAEKYNCIILASGITDVVTDGKRTVFVKNGCRQLSEVTGTGCMQGALIACYLTVCSDIYSTAAACVVFGICGQLSETEKGNGSFLVNLMDKLSVITDSDIEKHIKTEEKEIEKV